MKSNTVIFTEPYKAEIQEIDCPKPGKSEVLIRTEQTLISTGTELTFLTGECPENQNGQNIFTIRKRVVTQMWVLLKK